MAAGDCEQQDECQPATKNPEELLTTKVCKACSCCCAAAITSISIVLALEAEEDLEVAEGCRRVTKSVVRALTNSWTQR